MNIRPATALAVALLALTGCGTGGKPLLGASLGGSTETAAANAKVKNGGIIAAATAAHRRSALIIVTTGGTRSRTRGGSNIEDCSGGLR